MTTTKNEMIAEFMGLPITNGWVRLNQRDSMTIDNLKYSTSWDWMMPVVERINEMSDGYTCLSIDHDQVFVHRKDGEMLNFLYKENGGMLPTIYLGVCAAIEWMTVNN